MEGKERGASWVVPLALLEANFVSEQPRSGRLKPVQHATRGGEGEVRERVRNVKGG